MQNNFTEEDKKQVVDFLNFIAERATFKDWNTQDSVKHFKMLSYMQNKLLPKIDANILEVVKVIPAKESVETKED